MEERKVVVGDEGKGAAGGQKKARNLRRQRPRGREVWVFALPPLMAPRLHIKPGGAPGSTKARSVSR